MRVCLINPAWSFAGSIYFGCREAHLPLELGYSRALLEEAGHETLMLDGALDGLTERADCRAGRFVSTRDDRDRHGAHLLVLALRPTRTHDPGRPDPDAGQKGRDDGRGRPPRVRHAQCSPQKARLRHRRARGMRGDRGPTGRQAAPDRRASHHLASRRRGGDQWRAARRRVHPSACPALACRMARASRAPPSPLWYGRAWAGRRGGSVPRLSLSLQLLREDRLS